MQLRDSKHSQSPSCCRDVALRLTVYVLITLSLPNILSISTVSLALRDGALSFGFLTGGSMADLGDEVSAINLPDLLRRLCAGLI